MGFDVRVSLVPLVKVLNVSQRVQYQYLELFSTTGFTPVCFAFHLPNDILASAGLALPPILGVGVHGVKHWRVMGLRWFHIETCPSGRSL